MAHNVEKKHGKVSHPKMRLIHPKSLQALSPGQARYDSGWYLRDCEGYQVADALNGYQMTNHNNNWTVTKLIANTVIFDPDKIKTATLDTLTKRMQKVTEKITKIKRLKKEKRQTRQSKKKEAKTNIEITN